MRHRWVWFAGIYFVYLLLIPGSIASASTVSLILPEMMDMGSGLTAVPDRYEFRVPAPTTSHIKLPVSFIENIGQVDEPVRFVVWQPDSTLFFTQVGLTIANRDGSVVHQEFIGTSPGLYLSGLNQQTGIANFFSGNNPSEWRTNVPMYEGIEYRNLYPDIDLRYFSKDGTIKREFIVQPGGDPGKIHFEYPDADIVSIGGDDSLWIFEDNSTLVESPVVCYQEIQGGSRQIPATYTIINRTKISISVADYNHSSILVIDPSLAYSTFIGGTNEDFAYDLALDSSGDTYITGNTLSTNYPSSSGAWDTTKNGAAGTSDVFVTKVNASGSGLGYSTYIGGAGNDYGYAIAVNSSGCAIITGKTTSANFPVTTGSLQGASGGGTDAFVTKFNQNGTALEYSTYLGGNFTDTGYGIAIDTSDNAYVTGETLSLNFSTTPGVIQPVYGGGIGDAFITKLKSGGSTLVYSTFIGGSIYDTGRSVAVDETGAAYITGYTSSADFPVRPGALQGVFGGGTYDVFITKVNPDGTSLTYSTYLGGLDNDFGQDLAIDGTGNSYVAGYTGSSTFPVTIGAIQSIFSGGGYDAVLTKINPTGSEFVYSTFIGGEGSDKSNDVAIDSNGNVYLTGTTSSVAFPNTSSAYKKTFSGGSYDAFVTELSPDGSDLIYSSYLGGSSDDYGIAVVTAPDGFAFLAGYTKSGDFPSTAGAFRTANTGLDDAYITKILTNPPIVGFNRLPLGGTAPVTISFTDFSNYSPISWNWSFGDGNFSTLQNPAHTYADAGTFTVSLNVTNSAGSNMSTKINYVTVLPYVPPTTAPPSLTSGSGESSHSKTNPVTKVAESSTTMVNVGGNSAVTRVIVSGSGLSELVVTATRHTGSSAQAFDPKEGMLYEYFDVTPARYTTISRAIIDFAVPASWLDQHRSSPEDIVLYHFDKNTWNQLPTRFLQTSNGWAQFESESPGFSSFAIIAAKRNLQSSQDDRSYSKSAVHETIRPAVHQAIPESVKDQGLKNSTPVHALPSEPGTSAFFIAIAAILALILCSITLIRRWSIRRQNPTLFRKL